MAAFCTIADLLMHCSPVILAGLADDVNTPPDINAANTVAVLNEFIAEASNDVRTYVLGRLDFGDSQVSADLKMWARIIALRNLFQRRGHYGPANPWTDQARETKDTLKAIREGRQNSGTTEQPSLEAYSTTGDSDPVFGQAASDGLGRDSNFWRRNGW